MTKTELEQKYQSLYNDYKKTLDNTIETGKFIDTNLEVFRNGLADECAEYNVGVKDTLVVLGKLWNLLFDKIKIEMPYEFNGEIIQFPKKEEE